MFSGWQKLSLIDYPEKMASVVFTQGCNLNCYYCHNSSLIPFGKGTIHEETVLDYLQEHRFMIDALVISGGEPTLHRSLAPFLSEVKSMDISVKLDTNGTHPDRVASLISRSLVDYLAMDWKCTSQAYTELTRTENSVVQIKETFSLLRKSAIPWEVRTTVAPSLTLSELRGIALQVREAPLWRLQPYQRPENPPLPMDSRVNEPSLNRYEIESGLRDLRRIHHNIVLM